MVDISDALKLKAKVDHDQDKWEVCIPESSEGGARNQSSGAKTGEVGESRRLAWPQLSPSRQSTPG